VQVRYLIWSNERGMWWKPNHNGYTTLTHEAGLYSEEEARRIYAKANFDPGNLNEVVCRVPWNTFAREQFDWAVQERLGSAGHAAPRADDIPF